jgi:hypothetical protein
MIISKVSINEEQDNDQNPYTPPPIDPFLF